MSANERMQRIYNIIQSLDTNQWYDINTEYRNGELYKITITKENKK